MADELEVGSIYGYHGYEVIVREVLDNSVIIEFLDGEEEGSLLDLDLDEALENLL